MPADSIHKKFLVGGTPNTTKSEGCHLSADPTGETDHIAYASGRSAVVRSLSDPADYLVFLAHTANVTVARFSPDGKLVASADEYGIVKVWDAKTGIEKTEFQGSSSIIRDIVFLPDMKFMLIGGEAKGTYAKPVKYPSGGSTGSCKGHIKRVLAVDGRQKPSKQLICASEDFKVSVHKGPPVSEFAVPTLLTYHSNFVNDIRYSPDQMRFASCSTDRTVCIVNAETLEVEFTMNGHEASVLQVCWSADGTELYSCGSDKTVRVWDTATGTEKAVITVGDEPWHMQCSVVYVPKTDEFVSLSLSGELNVFDRGATAPKAKLRGHAKVPVGISLVGDSLFSADYSGAISCWDVSSGKYAQSSEKSFSGSGPITLAAIGANSKVVATVGSDGNVFLVPTETLEFPEPINIKGGGLDICVTPSGEGLASCVVLNESRMVALGYDGSTVAEYVFESDSRAICVAVSPDGAHVAFSYEIRGGEGILQFATLEGGEFKLSENKVTMHTPAHRMAFSPDGSTVVVGEVSRRVKFYTSSGEDIVGGGLVHTARVDAVAFAPDGKFATTGGLDGSVAVWEVGVKGEHRRLQTAHRGGVTGIAYAPDGTIYTTGGDNTIVAWSMDPSE
uniref:Anaphase-promoting complex subunit 4 WD40 domain-containing protein n=1 Tax=Timspurckia oligopyrenoides TaxID=708627 RepID=A0A7S1ERG3_9RHOD|mmetsp:Transcript_1862/g.3318  ORF Transcript_1862/g.3318 Transcript_1862/m.3318 type:complete len:618 (+) Transcript_1862:87-1940(+)|eukprot:CAMPEP_0182452272 /NCGR_PEP_ID=MMETSP1172-20130603/44160_1 /TAXON_ID=708627 /ORGANISM="Timspurckia oligopyrenoides, Strain CCMP3278" /LENGTH=617 /DNA_ID=CAMNT_0024650097 /DNA_START=77 /DNA_END=1930 /DNA_ORIENTATION=-